MDNDLATADGERIPTTLLHSAAARFWLAVLLTGACTGISAAVLTRLFGAVQRLMWPGPSSGLLVSVRCSLISSQTADACPTSNAGFWSRAAQGHGMASAYGVPLGGGIISL